MAYNFGKSDQFNPFFGKSIRILAEKIVAKFFFLSEKYFSYATLYMHRFFSRVLCNLFVVADMDGKRMRESRKMKFRGLHWAFSDVLNLIW